MMNQRKHRNPLVSGAAAVVGSAAFYLFFRKARKKHKARKLNRNVEKTAETAESGDIAEFGDIAESNDAAEDAEETSMDEKDQEL